MKLHTETISRLLNQTVMELMKAPQLQSFRIADSAALCLQFGHRFTNEIDLYSPELFREADFTRIKNYLQSTFGHGEHHHFAQKGEGTSFFISNLNQDYGKIDIYYGVPFSEPPVIQDHYRFAAPNDLMALALENVRKGGQKVHFWDLHFLFSKFSPQAVLAAHKTCYPNQHNKAELRRKLVDFSISDDDFDPKCLLKKNWNLIKLDLMDWAREL